MFNHKLPEIKFIDCSLCEKKVEYTKLMQIVDKKFNDVFSKQIDNKEFLCQECMDKVKDLGNMYKI
tara:strand:+ start:173 stop:370 length:198 start_codon:yes stop_codon:yes gene_type:complete